MKAQLSEENTFDTICFSHLRWDFVFQRPQHLMTRFAERGRVYFIEEPLPTDGPERLEISERGENLKVCVPRLHEPFERDSTDRVAAMIRDLAASDGLSNYINWFYTPMMLDWSHTLTPLAVVYDCMDELSQFKNAPPELCEKERELFERADLVFTGGRSLYEAKKAQHHSVHAFPSSIDKEHFARALDHKDEVNDQAGIPHPRIGFVGVIDERADLELLASSADLRPDWHFIMIGPVVKIDENSLPRRQNIHYLGQKDYAELPAILSGWDVAIMPFAMNESTRFISPTKTPEYLAAGLPVVSTPVADVVTPYGDRGLVRIASTPDEFVNAIEMALKDDRSARQLEAREFLKDLSWDRTFDAMYQLIAGKVGSKKISRSPSALDGTYRGISD